MDDRVGQMLILSLLLILPLSALVARRLPMATMAKYALAWAGVFLIGWLAVLYFT